MADSGSPMPERPFPAEVRRTGRISRAMPNMTVSTSNSSASPQNASIDASPTVWRGCENADDVLVESMCSAAPPPRRMPSTSAASDSSAAKYGKDLIAPKDDEDSDDSGDELAKVIGFHSSITPQSGRRPSRTPPPRRSTPPPRGGMSPRSRCSVSSRSTRSRSIASTASGQMLYAPPALPGDALSIHTSGCSSGQCATPLTFQAHPSHSILTREGKDKTVLYTSMPHLRRGSLASPRHMQQPPTKISQAQLRWLAGLAGLITLLTSAGAVLAVVLLDDPVSYLVAVGVSLIGALTATVTLMRLIERFIGVDDTRSDAGTPAYGNAHAAPPPLERDAPGLRSFRAVQLGGAKGQKDAMGATITATSPLPPPNEGIDPVTPVFDGSELVFITARDVTVQCVAFKIPVEDMEVTINLAATVASILGDDVFMITGDRVITFYEGPHRVESAVCKAVEVQETLASYIAAGSPTNGSPHAMPGSVDAEEGGQEAPSPCDECSPASPAAAASDMFHVGICADGEVMSGKIRMTTAFFSRAIATAQELSDLCGSFEVFMLLAASNPPVFIHQSLAATQVDLLSFNYGEPTPIYTVHNVDADAGDAGYGGDTPVRRRGRHSVKHDEYTADVCMTGWGSIKDGKLVSGKNTLTSIKSRVPWVQAMQRRVARLITIDMMQYSVTPQVTTGLGCGRNELEEETYPEEEEDNELSENREEREYRMIYVVVYIPERKFINKLKEILISFVGAVGKHDGIVDQLTSDKLIARWRVEYMADAGIIDRNVLAKIVGAVRLVSSTLPQPFHVGVSVGEFNTIRLKNRETFVSDAKNRAIALAMMAYNYCMTTVTEADILDASMRQTDSFAHRQSSVFEARSPGDIGERPRMESTVSIFNVDRRRVTVPPSQPLNATSDDGTPESRPTNPLVVSPMSPGDGVLGGQMMAGTQITDTESVVEGEPGTHRASFRMVSGAVGRFMSAADITIPGAASMPSGNVLVCRKLTSTAYYDFVETNPVPRGRKKTSGFCGILRPPRKDVTLYEIITDPAKAIAHQEHAPLYNRVLRRIAARAWEKALKMLNRYNSVTEADHWTEFLLEQVQQAITDEDSGKRHSDDDLDLHINLIGEVAVGHGADDSSSNDSTMFSPPQSYIAHPTFVGENLNLESHASEGRSMARSVSVTSPSLGLVSPRTRKKTIPLQLSLAKADMSSRTASPSRAVLSPTSSGVPSVRPGTGQSGGRLRGSIHGDDAASTRTSRTTRTAGGTLVRSPNADSALSGLNFLDRSRVRQYLGMSSLDYAKQDGQTTTTIAVFNAWNLVRLTLLIVDCFITPARAAAAPRHKGVYDPLNVAFITLGYLTDLVYFIDILQNFHEPVTNDLGVLISDPREIRVIYLMGWFTFDLLGMFPWELIMMAATRNTRLLVSRPEIRLNRLVNMLRMPSLTYVVANAYFPEVHPVLTKVFVHVFVVLMILFWIGCLWNFMLTDYWPSTRFADSVAQDDLFRHSLRGFHWSIRGFAGYGQPWPAPDEEYLPALINVIFGIGAFATVIAYCHSTLGMTHDAVFQERLDEIVKAAEELKVGDPTTIGLLRYHRTLWEKTGQVYRGQFDDLKEELPRELSMELTYFANIRALQQIPSLMAVQDDRYIVHLACKLVHYFGVPEEILIEQGESFQENFGIFFLLKGSLTAVANNAVIETITPGSYWGELSCMNSCPQPASLVATEFSDVYFLPYSTFRDFFEQYPACAEVFVDSSARRRQAIRASVAAKEQDEASDVDYNSEDRDSMTVFDHYSHTDSPRSAAASVGRSPSMMRLASVRAMVAAAEKEEQ